jgi:signal transduction histidine kinase/ActR/RegA family two-component response regulator
MHFIGDRKGTFASGAAVGVPMLAMAAGFGVLYRRAFRARAAAERLAEDVRSAKIHLEQAQRVAGVGSWEYDTVRRRLTWSAEHARLHDWTGPEPPEGPAAVLELIALEDRPRVAAAMRAVLTQRGPIELEYRVVESRGGRLIHVQATSVLDAHGRPTRVIGTSRDVTERYRRTEAERANHAKNEFISRMSHELRTPLNAILGFGQLMTMSELDDRQRGNVDHILTAGRHLLDLINEILDISRIESGDLKLAVEPVSTRAVIEEAIDLVTPTASARQIEVSVECCCRDELMLADPQRLKQVLLNLLSNAVKYNNPGGHVRVRCVPGGEDRIQMAVEDDGPGIAPASIERLFSPFERLGAEQSSVEGTGLGLAVSRGLIEAMGGRIHARSELGRGTAFTVELAAAATMRAPGDPAAAGDGQSARPAGQAATVLCIDDNPSNLHLIEQVLARRPDTELITAMRGELGTKLALEHAPDVILLDLNLPDMSGEEVLARLKASPATRALPVVILAADTSPVTLERVLAAGARLHLTKPLEVNALLSAIDGLVSWPLSDVA